ncbi:GNAT family N-acetyltransferase [Kaistia defluvii]|uniref:GNAT family N-acetyltransferase n=1 Tax=Kaistia defluvii TaxID=410841 RepID=UPI0022543BD0|nr:GNAT family N-acetyltransferase [Kaistia defluvii]MCX5518494.1 GNAT family N-acetyltransferase [Kaistia defluvii]
MTTPSVAEAPTSAMGPVARPAEDNPFFSAGILGAAQKHLGDPTVTIAAIADASGDVIALAPVRSTPLGRLIPAMSIWVHPHGPLGTPLLDAGAIDAAAAGLIAAMDGGKPGQRILEFPYLPLAGPVADALRHQAEITGRPIAVLGAHRRAMLKRTDSDPARFQQAISAKKRRELARQLRRLGELGTLTVEHVSDRDRLAAALEDFFALEASGWKGRRGTALMLREPEKAFAKAAVAGGDARIHAIRLDGRAVAMLVSFTAGRSAVTWKIAYDEAYARFSPGVHIMLEASVALLADPAIDQIDSIAIPDHPMVDPIWPDRLEIGTLVIGPKGGGLRYEIGLALARLELNLRALARRLVRTARRKAGALKAGLRRSPSTGSPPG